MDVVLKLHRGEKGLNELTELWTMLSTRIRSRRHVHRIEWHIAVARTFEKFSLGELIYVSACTGRKPIAILPFQAVGVPADDGSILRALELISNPSGEQSIRDVLIDKDYEETTLLQEILIYLSIIDPSWDLVSLRGILADSCALRSVQHGPELDPLLTPGGHWGKNEFVSCGATDDPFSRLSKSFKQNLRTSHNKLKSRRLGFRSATDLADLRALFETFLSVETSGWKGEQGSSVRKDPVTEEFLVNLITLLSADLSCEIHIMELDDRPIAALFCVIENNILFIVRTGYDESAHLASPGHLIVEHILSLRGASGNIDLIAPYNAPPWFRAWRPDKILGIYNGLIYRTDLASKMRSGSIETNDAGRGLSIWQRAAAAVVARLFNKAPKSNRDSDGFRCTAAEGDWSSLISARTAQLPQTATRVHKFPVDIDPRILSVGVYENGWIGHVTRFDFVGPVRESSAMVLRGYVPRDDRYKDQTVCFSSGEDIILKKNLQFGDFDIELPLKADLDHVKMDLSHAVSWPEGDNRLVACRLISIQLIEGQTHVD